MTLQEEFPFVFNARALPNVFDDGRLTPAFVLWLVYETNGFFGQEKGLLGFTEAADLRRFLACFSQG